MAVGVETTWTIRGDKELVAALRRLPRDVERRVVRSAVNRASKPLRNAFIAAAPSGPTGNLKASIKTRIKKYAEGMIVAVTGPRWPEGAHAHLLEFGTVERWHKHTTGSALAALATGRESRQYTGMIRPRGMFKRAYLSVEQPTTRLVMDLLWDGIRKQARKAKR